MLLADVYRLIQRWLLRARSRYKLRVPKVGGLMILWVIGRGLFDYGRPAWSVFPSGAYRPLQSLWLGIRIRYKPRFPRVGRVNGSYCCLVRLAVCGVLLFDVSQPLVGR